MHSHGLGHSIGRVLGDIFLLVLMAPGVSDAVDSIDVRGSCCVYIGSVGRVKWTRR
jgi:hypothetical protein